MLPLPTRPCPACGSAEVSGRRMLHDRVFQAVAGGFAYFRCAACSSLYIDPLPEAAEVAAFYPPAYWWDPSEDAARVHLRWAAVYRRWVIRDHLRFLPKIDSSPHRPARLLDAGCGSGSFLREAQKQGFAVAGLDISAQAVSALQRQGIDAAWGTLADNDLGERRFDVITLFHVLEHLADPQKELQALLGHLSPGGHLIAQVPNRSSLQARVFADRWYGLDPPRHLTQFSRMGLLRLLETAGLRTISTFCFSLRDNAPAMASSLMPGWDPKARMVRCRAQGKCPSRVREGLLMGAYFSLVFMATPLALLEASIGAGGTLTVQAVKQAG
jgi:SAM-dependent methyltransferase